ncbi:NAD(P)-dependent oxidoreductase [Patescibacteria group bacterium]|nr:NAD(P)-dependent oxidoreductase [Patescibacteria group bacterium]
MKTILITGVNGFVGQNLINHFRKNNWKIIAIDKLKNPFKPFSNELDYITADIINKDVINNILSNYSQINLVIHTAGISDHFPNTPWNEYLKINVCGSKNIAQLSSHYNIKYFVYLSSASVYGREYKNVIENDNLYGYDFYSQSKILAEKEILNSNSNSIILRPSPFYGFGDPKNTVYKLFHYMSKTHISPKMHGTTKSLCYIENLIDFLELLINNNKCFGEIYNVADAEPYDLSYITSIISSYLNTFMIPIKIPKFLSDKIRNLINRKYSDTFLGRSLGSMLNNTSLNIDKAKNSLQYYPKFDLKSGLEKCNEWYSYKI